MFEIGSDRWPGISKLVEECGETLQVAGKLMGTKGEIKHWDMANRATAPNATENLTERLQNELADLQAAIIFVTRHCNLDLLAISERSSRKLERFEMWHRQQTAESIR
jgi:NTP pyrophosphatase (non-canonical NTP hydrolase)